jgi:hypothetical protein
MVEYTSPSLISLISNLSFHSGKLKILFAIRKELPGCSTSKEPHTKNPRSPMGNDGRRHIEYGNAG